MGLLDAFNVALGTVKESQPRYGSRLSQALANQQAEKDRANSVMSKPAEVWKPDYERVGGHALEAPMISPDDLIGTGIPSRIGTALAAAGKAVAAKGGLGMIPIAGMIKSSGKISPKSTLPNGVLQEMIVRDHRFDPSDQIDSMGNVWNTGRDANIKALNNGDFLLRSGPTWPSKGPTYYAIGDDTNELVVKAGNIAANSDAGRKSAYSQTLIGRLEKEFGDVFDTAKSTQSKSKYITHTPSGTKIRISDHDLPLHYEQPDLDLRQGLSQQEMIDAIKNALGR